MLTQQGTQSLSPQITLLVPREQAGEALDTQLERGNEIRNERIRSREELDAARQLKKEWVRRNNELFERLFSETTIVEQYAAVTSTILPEFADLELFIEQFYEEMDQRLHRVKTIRRMVESVPEMVRRRVPKPIDADHERELAGVVTMERVAPAAGETASPPPQGAAQPAPQAAPAPVPQPVPPPQMEPQIDPPPAAELTAAPAAAERPPAPAAAPPAAPAPKSASGLRTVIILHGDSDSRQAVCDFLQKLDLKAQVFDGGLMECRQELEQLNGQAAFALLLLPQMPDRVAVDEDQPASPEERRLLLEVGYCAGRFGRGRTCALFPGTTAPRTDELGTSYLPLDAAGGWQLALARQIKQAGLEVDLNRIC